jgi:hypothetical protein
MVACAIVDDLLVQHGFEMRSPQESFDDQSASQQHTQRAHIVTSEHIAVDT